MIQIRNQSFWNWRLLSSWRSSTVAPQGIYYDGNQVTSILGYHCINIKYVLYKKKSYYNYIKLKIFNSYLQVMHLHFLYVFSVTPCTIFYHGLRWYSECWIFIFCGNVSEGFKIACNVSVKNNGTPPNNKSNWLVHICISKMYNSKILRV